MLFGGAGFIGRHLAAHLESLGFSVSIVDREQGDLSIGGPSATFGDVRLPFQLGSLPSRADLVVNLAAVHREPGHEPHEYWETNVEGAINVVRYCEAVDATDLVLVSSIAVYGATEDAVCEATVPCPSTDYGRSKFAAEEICRKWRAAAPAARRLTIVRPAVVFGRGEGGNFARLGTALARRRFVYPGRRDARKASGYVADLVRSITFVHDRNDGEITYNFANRNVDTLESICRTLSTVLGRRPPRLTLPRPLLLAAGWVGDRVPEINRRTGLSQRRIAKLTSSTNVEAKVLEELGFEYQFDMEGALRDWYEQPPKGQFV